MLLPDNLDTALSSIAGFIISSQFIWIWCTLILAYGLKWYLHLQKESLLLKHQLKRAVGIFRQYQSEKEFALNFDQIRHQLLGLSLLARPWQEYCQSLLFSAVQEGDKDKIKYDKIRATRDCHEAFTSETIIQPRIDHRQLAAIPTHLSSLGILGTFCGLSSGIFLARHGLAGGDMHKIQQSLSQLLSGASLAFLTSIAGILSSIFLSRAEKKTGKSLSESLCDFNSALSSYVKMASLEQMVSQQLQQNNTQIIRLEKISSGIEQLAKNKADINEKILKEIILEFRRALISSCGNEIKMIAEAFRHIHSSLEETKGSFNDSGKLMLDSLKEGAYFFKKNLHEISHQFQSSFSQTQEMVQKSIKFSVSETQATVKNCIAELESFVVQPSENLGKTISSLNNQLEESTRKWDQMTSQSIACNEKAQATQLLLCQQIEPLLGASRDIAGACQKAQDSLNRSSEAAIKIAESVQHFEYAGQSTQASWEQYCKRFEGVDRSLYQAFEQTRTSLNQYSEKVKNFTIELDKHMSKGILTLSGAVGDLHQAIGALPESLKQVSRQPIENQERPETRYPERRISY